jgi:2,3-bisphosphoglycerate-dependent phosphoglycerate mutase
VYLYLIRHAQSVNNANMRGSIYNDFDHVEDAPLSPLGHQQADYLAKGVADHIGSDDLQQTLDQAAYMPVYRIDALYSSPFQRALQTAKPLADALGMRLQLMMDIYEHGGVYKREGDPGSYRYVAYPGLTRQAMSAYVDDDLIPLDVTKTGWWTLDEFEPEAHFIARGAKVAAYLLEQAEGVWKGKHIAFVSHADFINMLLQTLLRGGKMLDVLPNTQSFMLPYNTSVTRVDFREGGYPVIRYFSRFDHLPLELVTY